MNHHQTMPSLIEYLDQNGVLELGDELAIKAAKKTYRKNYQRAYKRHQRSQRKEYQIQLSKEENKRICEAAKKHHLSPSKFIKKAALAYLQNAYLVPDNERIAQLEYLLSITYSFINQIAEKTPQLTLDYERLRQIIERLEREVTQALRCPPSLEMLIVKIILISEKYSPIFSTPPRLMIIKIKAIKSPDFERLIRYILPKRHHRSKRDTMFIFKHNLKGNRVEDWVQQFEENESFRIHKRTGNTILSHEIISFNAEDSPHIDVEMMKDFTKKYIEYRGLRGMYIAVPHFDTDNYHIHLCCSGVKYRTGKAMRLSRKEFQDLKIRMQEYQMQKYPQLQYSIVRHGRGKTQQKDQEYQVQKRSGQASKRVQIKEKVHDISLRSNSLEKFINSLESQNLKPYYRGGKLTGVISGKRKYRFKTLGVKDEIERISKREKRRNFEQEIDR